MLQTLKKGISNTPLWKNSTYSAGYSRVSLSFWYQVAKKCVSSEKMKADVCCFCEFSKTRGISEVFCSWAAIYQRDYNLTRKVSIFLLKLISFKYQYWAQSQVLINNRTKSFTIVSEHISRWNQNIKCTGKKNHVLDFPEFSLLILHCLNGVPTIVITRKEHNLTGKKKPGTATNSYINSWWCQWKFCLSENARFWIFSKAHLFWG